MVRCRVHRRMHRRQEIVKVEIQKRPLDGGGVRLVGLCDGEECGGLTALPLKVKLGGRVFKAWAGRDLEVDAAKRGSKLGLLLPEALWRESPQQVALCAATSEKARPVYEFLGYSVFDLPQFVVMWKSLWLLRGRNSAGLFKRIAAKCCDAVIGVYAVLLRVLMAMKLRGWRFEEIAGAPLSDCEAAAKIAAEDGRACAEVHDADWFRWAIEQGGCKLTFVRAAAEGGAPVGFVLTKRRVHETFSRERFRDVAMGHVIEWGVVPACARREPWVVVHAAVALRKTCDLVLTATEGGSVASLLRRLGWRPMGNGNFVIRAGVDVGEVDWTQSRNWRLRGAMADYPIV